MERCYLVWCSDLPLSLLFLCHVLCHQQLVTRPKSLPVVCSLTWKSFRNLLSSFCTLSHTFTCSIALLFLLSPQSCSLALSAFSPLLFFPLLSESFSTISLQWTQSGWWIEPHSLSCFARQWTLKASLQSSLAHAQIHTLHYINAADAFVQSNL